MLKQISQHKYLQLDTRLCIVPC